MATTNDGGDRAILLDAGVFTGIAVDIVLAIIVGILIYVWRKRISEKNDYKVMPMDVSSETPQSPESFKTEKETANLTTGEEDKSEDQKQVNPVTPLQRGREYSVGTRGAVERVAGSFAFLKNHTSQQTEDGAAESGVCVVDAKRPPRVWFTDLQDEEGTRGAHYPTNSDTRVVNNPLSAAHASGENVDPTQSDDIAVTTYYTYRSPDNQTLPNGEGSCAVPQPPSSFSQTNTRETILNYVETGRDVGSTKGSDIDPQKGPTMRMSEDWATMDLGEEEVTKLYNIGMQEATDIL